jgi:hypothetical protein
VILTDGKEAAATVTFGAAGGDSGASRRGIASISKVVELINEDFRPGGAGSNQHKRVLCGIQQD